MVSSHPTTDDFLRGPAQSAAGSFFSPLFPEAAKAYFRASHRPRVKSSVLSEFRPLSRSSCASLRPATPQNLVVVSLPPGSRVAQGTTK